MFKDIILLTTSKKYGNYCIAGVEKNTGNWVRIVSEDAKIYHAVTLRNMIYKDGSLPKVMDIIRIKCKYHKPNKHQPENHVLDSKLYWRKLGVARIEDLLRIHPIENKPFLLYDTNRFVDGAYINRLKDQDKYSLILIAPKDVSVHIRLWPDGKKITMSFDYNGNRYWYISITDIEFLKQYLRYPEGNYNYKNKCLLVISLGDMFKDKKHYKLIAKVLVIN